MADARRDTAPLRPRGGGGGRALADHLACEQLTSRRRFLTSVLALLSAPVWAMALWPQLLVGPDRRFLLYLFGFLLASSAWAAVEERRAVRRLRRTLADCAGCGELGRGSGSPNRP